MVLVQHNIRIKTHQNMAYQWLLFRFFQVGRGKNWNYPGGEEQKIPVFYLKIRHFTCLKIRNPLFVKNVSVRNLFQGRGSSLPLPYGKTWPMVTLLRQSTAKILYYRSKCLQSLFTCIRAHLVPTRQHKLLIS